MKLATATSFQRPASPSPGHVLAARDRVRRGRIFSGPRPSPASPGHGPRAVFDHLRLGVACGPVGPGRLAAHPVLVRQHPAAGPQTSASGDGHSLPCRCQPLHFAAQSLLLPLHNHAARSCRRACIGRTAARTAMYHGSPALELVPLDAGSRPTPCLRATRQSRRSPIRAAGSSPFRSSTRTTISAGWPPRRGGTHPPGVEPRRRSAHRRGARRASLCRGLRIRAAPEGSGPARGQALEDAATCPWRHVTVCEARSGGCVHMRMHRRERDRR